MHGQLYTNSCQIFFVKYRIDKGEARVEYFSSDLMLEDYFMNSLMGFFFKDLCYVVMRYK